MTSRSDRAHSTPEPQSGPAVGMSTFKGVVAGEFTFSITNLIRGLTVAEFPDIRSLDQLPARLHQHSDKSSRLLPGIQRPSSETAVSMFPQPCSQVRVAATLPTQGHILIDRQRPSARTRRTVCRVFYILFSGNERGTVFLRHVPARCAPGCLSSCEQLLIRLERKVNRLNFQKGIIETHDWQYKEKKNLLVRIR